MLSAVHTSLAKENATMIQEHIQVIIFGIIFAAIISVIAWFFGYYSFPEKKVVPEARVTFWEMLGAIGSFLLVILFVVPIITFIGLSLWKGQIIKSLGHDSAARNWYDAFSIAVSAAGLMAYCALLKPRARYAIFGAEAFMGIGRNIKDVLLGAATWIICYPLVIVLGQFISMIVIWLGLKMPHNEQVAVKYLRMTIDNPWLFWVTVLLLIFVVPFIEETLFRGFLQTWIKQKLGVGLAILVTSIIFALFHYSGSQGFDNIELLISLFILSCYLGFIRERQQSLFASIGLHGTFNAISIFVILFS